MRPGISSGPENRYVGRIDRGASREDFRGQGLNTEEFVHLFYDAFPGLTARFSTREEDKGPEIGGRQTVDIVVSFAGRPAFATQITTSAERGVIAKKLKEMEDHPFLRLEGMGSKDTAIPKVLVSLDALQIKKFFENPDLSKYPELSIKVIDDHIRSLTFDLSKTQNPLERKAVEDLIQLFKEEKKKYVH